MNRPARLGLLAAFGTVALPALAAAEGDRLALVCEPLAAGGDEAPAEAAAALPPRPAFTFAPLKTGRDGSGQIAATMPDGQTAPGVTASPQGPFAWTAGHVLHTLTLKGRVADGRALVLWHRLDQTQTQVPPVGALTKLICVVS